MDNLNKKRGLSHEAYGGVKGKDYIPFIGKKVNQPELTVWSILGGVIFAIFFAAANTYLGLKAGMTISAGIPSAILGTALLRAFRRRNILENNMVSGVAAMGESLAGGVIFVLPALLLMNFKLPFGESILACLIGGLIGIVLIIPLRRNLIVDEHGGELKFPESMAAAEVLVNANEGGAGLVTVITGIIVGGVYKFLQNGLALFTESPGAELKPLPGSYLGVNSLASLLGVGYIVGLDAGIYMFGGGVLAYLIIAPLIKFFGASAAVAIAPATTLLSDMASSAIRGQYIKPIGAGAVAMGGFISIIRTFPTIVRSIKNTLKKKAGDSSEDAQNSDLPMSIIIGAAVFAFLLVWLLPQIQAGFLVSLAVIVFCFLFSVVSARMCGIIGASNNPVSGMTIASLLFITTIFKATGVIGDAGIIAAIVATSIVCISIAVSGGVAQSLKTTFIIGGTPRKMEYTMYLGIAASSVVITGVILLLNTTYGLGGQAFSAPQAGVMATLITGIMNGNLPWLLIFVGAFIAIFCFILKLPILTIALGIYLPIDLSAAILVGGIIRWLVDRKFKNDENTKKSAVEKGTLLASGLIAGEAVIGILIALLAFFNVDLTVVGSSLWTSLGGTSGPPIMILSLLIFLALGYWVYNYSIKKD
ncbi:MAG: oligopeptide transporter, OPT family [Oscillospiraceae bacterium]|nr:oligopeptide transporter, OPT family [Oscillospiraceae bacterium]